LAAILTSVYVVNYKRHVQHGEGKVTVLVAARDIPAGTSGADVIDKNMLKEQTVARKGRVPGAITSANQLSQYVATQDIYQGEQVTARRFAPPQEQGVRAQIKGTQRAYQLDGNANQLLSGTLQVGDHVDVVGTWSIKSSGGDDLLVSRVVLRNLLVLSAPTGDSSGGVGGGNGGGMSVQLRVTDNQAQKLIWIQKNSVDNGYQLALRPPTGSLDSANAFEDPLAMLNDGPGRRAR
jgi:Flp pilus assembly protein CpaB